MMSRAPVTRMSRGGVTAPVTRHDTPSDLGTTPRVTPQPLREVTTTSEGKKEMQTMRIPDANIPRGLAERDRAYAARGDQFAGSADERHYGAELLGRVIGHATVMLAAARLCYTADDADTPEDVAAAGAAARWQAYTEVRRAVRPAVEAFSPTERLTIAADACRTAGL